MKHIDSKSKGQYEVSIIEDGGLYYTETKFGNMKMYDGKTSGMFKNNGYKTVSMLKKNSRHWNR